MTQRFASACGLAFIVCVTSAPALAQGTYISASLTGDIVRLSGSESAGVSDMPGGGEALGFALRAGTPLGSIWGVEAEFARPSEIESEFTPEFFPLGRGKPGYTVSGLYNIAPGTISAVQSLIFAPPSFTVQTRQRNTTLSAGVWARQDLSSRFSMVYLGGVSFNRSEVETEFSYGGGRPVIPGFPIPIPTSSVTKTTQYGARPFVGIESRVAMTEHLQLVPGVRLHGLESAWLVRPSLGLTWAF